MVIQHNMMAMNANRQSGLVNRRRAKSIEKLSSGYKINRAADDAAGLGISEKMRKQIRGLMQASKNIEDGISLCQIADGALNETIDILQRMRELAVQSANGTNSESDRQFIEMEIVQLKSEVDRIAKTTTFNYAIYPLNTPITRNDTTPASPTTPTPPTNPPGSNNPSNIILKEQTVTFVANTSFTHEGISYNVGDTVTITGMTTNGKEIRFDGGVVIQLNGSTNYSINLQTSNGKTFNVTKSNLEFDANGAIFFMSQSTGTKWYYAYKYDNSPDPIAGGEGDMSSYINQGYKYFTADNLDGSNNPTPPTPPTPTPPTPSPVPQYIYPVIYVQAGASTNVGDKIPIPTVDATCKELGITNLTVVTEDSSAEAMNLLDDAIAKVLSYRSTFGATQNRLEHAIMIDDNTAENTQAAESAIRDTDIAEMMMEYSVSNILMQAGQSMLAQANQSKQDVLSLIGNS